MAVAPVVELAGSDLLIAGVAGLGLGIGLVVGAAVVRWLRASSRDER